MRTTRRSLAAAAALVAFASGCGSSPRRASGPPPPRIPHALAVDFAARSDAVAQRLDAGDDCGALRLATQLQQRTIALIGRVPPQYQETLQGTVNDVVARIHCVPPAPAKHDNGLHKGKKEKHKHGEGDD